MTKEMQNKTVLITGCAGFIASRTTTLLLGQGYTVIGLDNMNDYYDVRIKEKRLEALKEKDGFTFIKADIEDFDVLKPLFQKHTFAAVLNLAARAGVRYSMENPFVYMTTNGNATLNLLELCRQHEVTKFLLASTSSLYAGQPMPFDESLPVNTPISPYAASKKAAEVMAYSYHKLYDLDVSIVRYFTVFGPAGRPDMSIFRFIKWIDEGSPIELFGDGTQSRDWTYVDDIARGTIAAATQNVGYEIFNLGGGRNPKSLNYFIELIEKELGKKAIIERKPFHIADIKETWANISKAKEILNWEPQISPEEGLKKTVDWYKANRDWLKDVKL